MILLKDKKEIDSLIEENIMAIVYFSGAKCGACSVIKEKIEKILEKYPKIQWGEINGEEHIDIAVSYGVFSLPILLLYVDKKECIRVGRNVDLLELERNIDRYYGMVF